jgi:hypothetical protein
MVSVTRWMAKPFVGYMLVHYPFWTVLSEFLVCFVGLTDYGFAGFVLVHMLWGPFVSCCIPSYSESLILLLSVAVLDSRSVLLYELWYKLIWHLVRLFLSSVTLYQTSSMLEFELVLYCMAPTLPLSLLLVCALLFDLLVALILPTLSYYVCFVDWNASLDCLYYPCCLSVVRVSLARFVVVCWLGLLPSDYDM